MPKHECIHVHIILYAQIIYTCLFWLFSVSFLPLSLFLNWILKCWKKLEDWLLERLIAWKSPKATVTIITALLMLNSFIRKKHNCAVGKKSQRSGSEGKHDSEDLWICIWHLLTPLSKRSCISSGLVKPLIVTLRGKTAFDLRMCQLVLCICLPAHHLFPYESESLHIPYFMWEYL